MTCDAGTLGKYQTGKGCISLKRLAEADPDRLARLIEKAYQRGGVTGDSAG